MQPIRSTHRFFGYAQYNQYTADTSLFRQARCKRLRRKARLSRLKYRPTCAASLTKLRLRSGRAHQEALLSARPTSAKKLVARAQSITAASPLLFQRPAVGTVKSAGAKNKAILAAITLKEGRYKLTAQYAESLLEFIPAFIGQLLSKKIKMQGSRVHYKTAQYLIRNIY